MEYVPMNKDLWAKKQIKSNSLVDPYRAASQYLAVVFPGWTFAFFTGEDVEKRRLDEGYIVIVPDHFKEAKQEWNSEVSMRVGFKEKDGGIMLGDCYVCGRPLDWDKKRRRQVQRESEDRYSLAARGRASMVKDKVGGGVEIGASFTETQSNAAPWDFTEGSRGEDGKAEYTNASEALEKAKPKAGRPKGS
jgi:hypothetical protein